jgi:hypothetical protein
LSVSTGNWPAGHRLTNSRPTAVRVQAVGANRHATRVVASSGGNEQDARDGRESDAFIVPLTWGHAGRADPAEGREALVRELW